MSEEAMSTRRPLRKTVYGLCTAAVGGREEEGAGEAEQVSGFSGFDKRRWGSI